MTIKKIVQISIIFIINITLSSCAELLSKHESTSEEEAFDIIGSPDLKQISDKSIKGGWMYKYTNDGLPENNINVKNMLLAIEVEGKSEPIRLSNIFPKNCYELSYDKKIKNNYLTWIDILVCPKYENESTGLLVINKAIQGSKKFYSATQYIMTPPLKKKINH